MLDILGVYKDILLLKYQTPIMLSCARCHYLFFCYCDCSKQLSTPQHGCSYFISFKQFFRINIHKMLLHVCMYQLCSGTVMPYRQHVFLLIMYVNCYWWFCCWVVAAFLVFFILFTFSLCLMYMMTVHWSCRVTRGWLKLRVRKKRERGRWM